MNFFNIRLILSNLSFLFYFSGAYKHKNKLHKHKNDAQSFHHTSSTRRSFSSASAPPLISSVPLSSSTIPSATSSLPFQDMSSGVPKDPPPPYTPTATPTNYPLYVNTFQTPGPGAYSSYIPFTHPSYVPYTQQLLLPQPVQSLNTLQALQNLQHQQQQQQQNMQYLQQYQQQMQNFYPTLFHPTQAYESSLLLQVAPNAFVSNGQSQSQQTESLAQKQSVNSSLHVQQNQNLHSNLEQSQKPAWSQSVQSATNQQYPRQFSSQCFQNAASSTAVLKVEGFEPGARFDIASKSIPPPPPGVQPNEAQLAVMRGQNVEVTQKKSNKLTGGKGAGFTFW